MKFRKLGDIEVSLIGLGTMTWGQQNTEAEAHEQLDLALQTGINLIDTAEMYPVPPMAETQGRTEEYVGSWLHSRGTRDQVVLATKVTGRAEAMDWIRGGPVLSRDHIVQALENSLRRLQTDHVDLYQVHWPDRQTNFFGQLGYSTPQDEAAIAIGETLATLDELVRAGKARQVGISNETPWGLSEYLRLAAERGWPRVVSVQNPYNLLNRSYEVGLAESADRSGIGLLAYSPLAFGVLSGKYLDGARPAGSRLTLFERFARYGGELAEQTTARYVAIAREHGLDPAQMALAYVNSRPFVTSNLVGATSLAQLRMNIDSVEIELDAAALEAIELVHRATPNPCP